jgi:DNA-binding SARP family transcriptional activator
LQAVADDGRRVDIGGPKQRDLLAMLLVQLNQFVPASRLIDELWDGAPPASADVTLRTHVSRLRQRLAAVGSERALVTRPSGYGLVLDPELVDSYRFERLAGLGQALGLGKPERAEQLLRAALELWRGEVLEDLGSPGYAQSEATRLDELRLVTLESRMDADLARPAPPEPPVRTRGQHDHPPPRSSPGSRNSSLLLRPEQRAPDGAGVKDPRPLRGRP